MRPAPEAPRGGHAALMDRVYHHQRYIYDFTRKYYLFGRDRLICELDLAAGEAVVEIGCGTARNLIAMARHYPGARLYGLDASHEMLKSAERNVARAGLSDRIMLAQGYGERLTPDLFGRSAPFDRAVFAYSLSMISEWYQALTAAQAALADDGRLHVVDFGDFGGLPLVARHLLRGWLGHFHVEPRTAFLRATESAIMVGAREPGADTAVSILAGRYAFVFSCHKSRIPAFAL